MKITTEQKETYAEWDTYKKRKKKNGGYVYTHIYIAVANIVGAEEIQNGGSTH